MIANVWKNSFAFLQKIGKSLMLPVALLPAAGILLGVGSAEFAIFPDVVNNLMKAAGGAIFGNLALLFALGNQDFELRILLVGAGRCGLPCASGVPGSGPCGRRCSHHSWRSLPAPQLDGVREGAGLLPDHLFK